jgi:hypothetical protein
LLRVVQMGISATKYHSEFLENNWPWGVAGMAIADQPFLRTHISGNVSLLLGVLL